MKMCVKERGKEYWEEREVGLGVKEMIMFCILAQSFSSSSIQWKRVLSLLSHYFDI